MGLLSEFRSYAGFLRELPAFLRERLTADEARAIVARRMAERESNFGALIEHGVFGHPGSPYRVLMEWAGCEAGDVRGLVRDRGVEGALRVLRESGVYVTFEEFKGLRPIVRGGRELAVGLGAFDNPSIHHYFAASTGGSTGRPRRVLMDLAHLRARLPATLLMSEAHGLLGAPFAQWAEIPPGHGLEAAIVGVGYGLVPDRWFTPVWSGPGSPGARFRWAAQAAVAVARASGVRFPRPEYLPFDRAEVIVRWAEEALRTHGRCGIRAHVSKALRIALAARELGVDLKGTTISTGGEPLTRAKVRGITGSGARVLSTYFLMEAGPIGFGCTTAADPGDVHLVADHLAMIAWRREVPAFGVAVDSFHYTTLLPTAPKILLNVETDDFGVVEERSCGCPLESLGYGTHLSDIRSFSKLTGEGVTLIGSDMIRILEEDLPARFGGSPLDYQLVEEEDDHGFTRLTLLVRPGLEIGDEAAVIGAVHEALRRAGGGADVSRAIWGQAQTLRLRREAPRLNARGKLWPIHSARRLRGLESGDAGSADAAGGEYGGVCR